VFNSPHYAAYIYEVISVNGNGCTIIWIWGAQGNHREMTEGNLFFHCWDLKPTLQTTKECQPLDRQVLCRTGDGADELNKKQMTDGMSTLQASLWLYDGWCLIGKELIYYFEQTVEQPRQQRSVSYRSTNIVLLLTYRIAALYNKAIKIPTRVNLTVFFLCVRHVKLVELIRINFGVVRW
jgi:hypothetical protein